MCVRELGCLHIDLLNSSLVQVFIYLDHKGVGINVWLVVVYKYIGKWVCTSNTTVLLTYRTDT